MKEIALLSSILSYSTTQAQYDNDDEDFEGSGSGDFAPPVSTVTFLLFERFLSSSTFSRYMMKKDLKKQQKT